MIYKIKMKKNDFFKVHNKIKTNDLEISDDEVKFTTDSESFQVIKNSKLKYHLQDSLKIKLLAYLKEYYLIIIGFFLFLSILYINSFRVSDIVFNMETPINSKIREKIEGSYRSLICFNFCNIDYNRFSKELQVEYTSYPFINVYASNNKVYVDIYDYAMDYHIAKNTEIGDIVATKDGIVDRFYVYSGTNQVYKNKFVKRGEVLVSGMITDNSYVSAGGLILAYTYEKVTIDVKKTQEEVIKTNSKQSYYQIKLFSGVFDMSKKENYTLCETNTTNVFNLFDFFTIKQIEETEKNVIIRTYNKESAVEYAKEKLEESFKNHRTNDDEAIVEIKEYHSSEDNDSFNITFLIKKYESIGVFRKN